MTIWNIKAESQLHGWLEGFTDLRIHGFAPPPSLTPLTTKPLLMTFCAIKAIHLESGNFKVRALSAKLVMGKHHGGKSF